MVLSAHGSDSLEIIALLPVNGLSGINPMDLIAPWDDSIGIVAFNPVTKY